MFKAIDYVPVWNKANELYANRTEDASPDSLITELCHEYGTNLVTETFSAVAQIKEYDGRIYGFNRRWIEGFACDPVATEMDSKNVFFRRCDLDVIHPANINQLIGSLYKYMTA